MRILFLNQYFPPDSASTAYMLGELCEDLARDHEVWVIAGRPSYGPEVGRPRPAGIRVREAWSTRFDRSSILGRVVNYLSYLASASIWALRVPRPDIVVTYTDPPFVSLIGVAASRYHRARFVQVYDDVYPDLAVALGRLQSRAVIWSWRRFNGLVRRRADRIVVLGRDMAAKLHGEGVPTPKLHVIRYWAEEVRPDPEAVARLRASLGWTERYVVMHAGNLGFAQGLDTLVEAAERLRDAQDVLIVFLGDGAARRSLQERSKERGLTNVQFLPPVPKEDAVLFIQAADLHVISLVPGLWGCAVPSKVYGIMASGRPMVAAVDEGSEVAVIVEEHGCGVRCDPGDPKALAEAVVEARASSEPATRGRHCGAFSRLYSKQTGLAAYRQMLLECVYGPAEVVTAGQRPSSKFHGH